MYCVDSEPARNVNRNLVNSRFGFLSCITGLTSVCLFGLTLAMCLTDYEDSRYRTSEFEPYRICPKQLYLMASEDNAGIQTITKSQCKGKGVIHCVGGTCILRMDNESSFFAFITNFSHIFSWHRAENSGLFLYIWCFGRNSTSERFYAWANLYGFNLKMGRCKNRRVWEK